MRWLNCKGKVDQSTISFLEKEIGIKFSKSYIETIANCDEGTPIASDFQYLDIDFERNRWTGIGCFFKFKYFKLWKPTRDIQITT